MLQSDQSLALGRISSSIVPAKAPLDDLALTLRLLHQLNSAAQAGAGSAHSSHGNAG